MMPMMRFLKTVTLPKAPAHATAHVCALGYYELFVNGKKVGEDVLAPAVSDYGKRGLYVTHDITPYLTEGPNCIGLWLGACALALPVARIYNHEQLATLLRHCSPLPWTSAASTASGVFRACARSSALLRARATMRA